MSSTLRALPVVAVLLSACGPADVCGGDACPPWPLRSGDAAVPDAGSPARPLLGTTGETGADGGVGGAGGGGAGPTACVPACQMKVCGSDGCGGTCGSCSAPETCTSAGRCACTPESDAEFCARTGFECGSASGSDNCGRYRSVASCGVCSAPETCGGGGVAGTCACVPQCSGKVCGPDGCGGTCGSCPGNSTCDATQTTCGCNAGYLPDPTGTSCVAKGATSASLAAIAGFPRNGYCLGGRTWVIPDPVRGLLEVDCGAGQCRLDGQPNNSGSCSCGGSGTAFESLTNQGTCPSGQTLGNGFGAYEVLLYCSTGRSIWNNCRAMTGSTSAVCSTWVTSFGWTADCYCGPCQVFDTASQRCEPICSGIGSCGYTPSSSTTYCY